ncbi:BBP7 family outer membrane beta-barrel protein [Crateriforma conspicua]|uniref:Outer membrane protein transport protein (OMPP1/FadL/TodX) n=1 Tax=Crateriforma conspicua TaxID=2527996 RepID=A0A5C5XQP3_9PLAN|nr:BBP7 family outer membrane beta-barrel protein [Crateriforma conspicua]TWT65517.1 hypothetical protein Pan14r_50630 [Crateriforma conspicua]
MRSPAAACLIWCCLNSMLAAQTGYGPVAPAYSPSAFTTTAQLDPYAMVVPTDYIASPMGAFPDGVTDGMLVPMANDLTGRFSDRLWFSAEYLYWRPEGMHTPALATTSSTGTPQNEAGILGFPNTTVLFGGRKINDDTQGGFRLRGGMWWTPAANLGIQWEYFDLAEQGDGFARSASGTTILARPFFDTTNDRETAQLIAFPNLVEGQLRIATHSKLRSFSLSARGGICPRCDGLCACGPSDRMDWIVGYRCLKLNDAIRFEENLNSLVTATPGTIALNESFESSNKFDGIQLGFVRRVHYRNVWGETLMRVSVGRNEQTVQISGTSDLTEFGVTESFTGGLLAQRSNIGTHSRDEFVMIPELGFTLGFRVTDWLDATLGYTVLYFPNVVRAGDHIDTDVNPNLIPEETVPLTGSLRPQFYFNETDYFAHGLSIGGEIRF